MEKIASFCVDHDKLKKGMYISRIDRDIITYDIRMVVPNCGVYLDTPSIHAFEHLFATYARNSKYTDQVVYVGPMGCRTGFYFLTRDLPHQAALDLFRDTIDFILEFEGIIPGTESSKECGNYLEHNLEGAKKIAADMKEVLKYWTVPMMDYDAHM
jgi:S-ribosylhomocysteine lyase